MSTCSVKLALYWDGCIEEGPAGSKYSCPAKRFTSVDESMRFDELMQRLYKITRTIPSQHKLRVFCRYPMSNFQQGTIWEHLPVDDDETLKDMLLIPKHFAFAGAVQLFILKEVAEEPIQPIVGPSLGVGVSPELSFTELLNGGYGHESRDGSWSQYGAVLRNDLLWPESSNGQQWPSGNHSATVQEVVPSRISAFGEYVRTHSLICPPPVHGSTTQTDNILSSNNLNHPVSHGGGSVLHDYHIEGGDAYASDEELDGGNGADARLEYRNEDEGDYDSSESWQSGSDSYESLNLPEEDGDDYGSEGEFADYHEMDDTIASPTPSSPESIPLEDEGTTIAFFHDIGDEKYHMADMFEDGGPPVWQDDFKSELEQGMVFESKQKLQHAVKMWSARVHRYFKVHESNSSTWFVRCIYYSDKACNWRVRGSLKKNHGYWEITTNISDHTCTLENIGYNHPNVDCNMVGRLVRDNVEANVLYKPCDVRTDVKRLGIDISYKKSWLGKQKAMKMVYGDWDESYQELPQFLLALQQSNPGTVVDWRHVEGLNSGYKTFHSVFWAFKASIDSFKHCRPVITIDGTHLRGKYKEKLLIAVGIDAAGHILPLAFALTDEENLANWSWFLENLNTHILDGRCGICIISDRHLGILHAFANNPRLQPPYVYHRFCSRHVKANFSKTFKNPALTDLMSKAARSHQVRKFNATMTQIRLLSNSAYNWLVALPLHKWTLCYDDGFRYGIKTTNHSESLNGVLKGARSLPVTACVRFTFFRLVHYFDKYSKEAKKYVTANDPWPGQVVKRFLRNQARSNYHNVTAFDSDSGLFQVVTGVHGTKGNNVHTVNLHAQTCTCGKYQIYKIPCSHVIKVCAKMGREAIELVDGFYTSQLMQATYSYHFSPLLHKDYWPAAPFKLFANGARRNTRRGRSSSLRIANEMDTPRMRQCKACGRHGHNQKSCPNIAQLRDRAIAHP